jgi:hypothetical protein
MALSLVNALTRRPRPGAAGSLALLAALALAAPINCGGDDDDEATPTDGGADDSPTGFPEVVLDGGGEIPDAPNGANLCADGTCNYQTQEGCTAEESCSPVFASGQVNPGCTTPGTVGLGEACEEWTDCARGTFCADGACRKLCCGGDWSACPTGESCIRQLQIRNPQNQAIIDAGVDLCFPVGTCDVLDVDSCADEPGRSCQIVDPVGNVACGRAGTAGIGEDCGTATLCGAGMSCVGGECRKLCRAVEGVTETGCRSDESCIHFRRDPAGVGECTPVG